MAMTVRVAAMLVAGTLGAIALLHLYWAVGGARARLGAVPERDGRPAFQPSRAATLAVAAALMAAAALVSVGGRLVPNPLPTTATRVLVFCLGGVLVARAIGDFRLVGFFKSARVGEFARRDTWLYSPLCLTLGIATLGIGYFYG
jgi:hypothetical protein